MFGIKHCIILGCSILLITLIVLSTKKKDLTQRSKILLVVGIISEIVKVFYYIIANEKTHGGILPKTDLPFHLCSIQIVFVIIVYLTKNEKTKRVILAYMLPSALIGGGAALLIPTTSALNMWVITFQYFIYHSVLVSFAIGLIVNKDFKLTIKDYYSTLLFILGLMFFSIYINSIIYDGVSNINFMYVASPPVENLPFLNEDNGWLVYICHYAFVIFSSITICYLKPIIMTLKIAIGKIGKN